MDLATFNWLPEVFYVVIMVWGVVDAVRRPSYAWQRVGHHRIAWIMLQLLAPFIGTILYFSMVRWRLKEVGRV